MLLFATGWIRADITALLVLVALVATGLLEAEQALQGFSSEAEESEQQNKGPALIETYGLKDRIWEVLIRRDSPLIRQQPDAIAAGEQYGLTVLSVIRHHESRLLQQGEIVLQKDDILLIGGRRERAEELVDEAGGLQLLGHPTEPEEFPASSGELVEAAASGQVGRADHGSGNRSGRSGAPTHRNCGPWRGGLDGTARHSHAKAAL